MKFLIWSKDRACQLDILLTSIKNNAVTDCEVDVIYKSSNNQFENSYQILAKEHRVNLIKQSDFYSNTVLSVSNSDFICLMTDDCYFYRQWRPEEVLARTTACFSYRLGLNTIIQDCHRHTFQPALNRYNVNDNRLVWNWTEYDQFSNYGYPFGLDGHLYDTQNLMKILRDIRFNNTNELESQLFHSKQGISQYMSSYQESCLVNIPINCMSNVTISGQEYSYSLETLNNSYLEGVRYIYDLNNPVVGCHQEFPLKEVCTLQSK